jgi:hypothetical protein
MVKSKTGVGRGVCWRNLLIAACAGIATLWTSAANATITQGDFSVFGFFETREAGRWGEGGSNGANFPTTFAGGSLKNPVTSYGFAASHTGGSFDFNHWDLVEMRQLADIRPDYHMVKNYKFMGRLDTLVLKDADFFAFYRPWYDAEGSLKGIGTAQPDRDFGLDKYTSSSIQQEYVRNDLREFYAQLNFTDNFSMRVGKQQVIWSEADALSGTELTNSSDLSYHWTHFESAENLRKNVRMVKLNYILPDFLKTANNEAEGFWIPGDYEGNGAVVSTDIRNPYCLRLPLNSWQTPGSTAAETAGSSTNPNATYNLEGQPVGYKTLADLQYVAMEPLTALGSNQWFQKNVYAANGPPVNSILNSEFGARYSSLLPVGNGLQMSLIYLYEARDSRFSLCSSCTASFARAAVNGGRGGKAGLPPFGTIRFFNGIYLAGGVFDLAPTQLDTAGSLRVPDVTDYRRNNFFGVTGTYYDKDLTDIVYRYDVLYAPKVGIYLADPKTRMSINGTPSSAWTEQTRWILAGDRPTYIPWISKQHTFLVAQYVNTWYPDRPAGACQGVFGTNGKLREDSNFAFVAATNWLINGQLTSTNAFVWDIDDNTGDLGSTNVYRYSRNILLGVNAIWYVGRSGRWTDPFFQSVNQRMSELEATFSYEI